MSRSFPLFLLFSACAFAQQAGQQMQEIITITPETVVAVINGRDFTAGDFERITKNVGPQMRALAASNPKEFLEDYGHSLALAAEAEKAKLHETSPYKERLADARNQILSDALVAAQTAKITIPAEDVKKQYDENRDKYRQAKAKVIFLSRVSQVANLADGKVVKSATIEEIQEKAETAAKKAKEGGDFVALAKEYSDDRNTAEKGGDLPYPIMSNATNIPQEMRDALLNAKRGEVVGPIEHQTGFYIFRVEAVDESPFEAVKDEITKEMKAAALNKWLKDFKAKSTTVKLQNEAFWQTFLAANKPAANPRSEQKPDDSDPPLDPNTAPPASGVK